MADDLPDVQGGANRIIEATPVTVFSQAGVATTTNGDLFWAVTAVYHSHPGMGA